MKIRVYEIVETLDAGLGYYLYRAVCSNGSRSVLIKKLLPEIFNASIAQNLEHQFEIARHIDVQGILRPFEFIPGTDGWIFVFDDPGGYPLTNSIYKKSLPLKVALHVVSEVAVTLVNLHNQGAFHQNIHPANLVVSEESGRTLIFGHCGAVPIIDTAQGGIALKRVLAPEYMSPEQTGRTNRIVDYRTDFYSLGIIFFKMLTGNLPFQAEGLLDWVHAHIAAKPFFPSDLCPEVPSVVSEIVLKLLAKAPEERYQCGEGLLHDLNQCLNELESASKISHFKIGLKDRISRFEFNHSLYGRDNELKKLAFLLESSNRGAAQTILFKGSPGVGKTVLVKTFRQAVLTKGGRFASSKSELTKRKTPYGAILNACRDLVQQLLTEDPNCFAELRQRLNYALGDNLGVLTKVIPEIESVLEAKVPKTVVGAIEARNRFQLCIHSFLQTFATKGQPLVLFLDDLQWADISSLEIIASLFEKGLEYFLFIGAYRSNVDDECPHVSEFVEKIKVMGKTPEILTIIPLSLSETRQILLDSLRPTKMDIEPLVRLVYRKCAGNPFYMKTLLSFLFDNHLLTFDLSSGWTWDLSAANKVGASENVLTLAWEKLRTLQPITRWVVAIAAMLGNPLDPEDLAIVCNLKVFEINDHLMKACQAGILVRAEQGYEFEHDQFKEAAVAQIPEDRQAVTHLRVGQILEKREGMNSERIFDIAVHMNQAISLLHAPSDLTKVALLNLEAGRRARADADFLTSFQFFVSGLSLINESWWQDQYELCLALHTEAAEAAFVSGNLDEAGRLSTLVQAHARNLLDLVPALKTKISTTHARGQEREALDESISVLEMLGVKIPARPTDEDVKRSQLQLMYNVEGILSDSYDEIPLMTDQHILVAMPLLIKASLSAGFIDENLYTLILGQLVNLTKKYGFCPESPISLVMAGGVCCLLYDNYALGAQIASFGLELAKKLPSNPWEPYCKFILANDVESFLVPSKNLSRLYEEAYLAATADGDFTLASICAYFHVEVAFHYGMNLDQLSGLLDRYLVECRKLGTQRSVHGLIILQVLIKNLLVGPETKDDAGDTINDLGEALAAWHSNAYETVKFMSLCHEIKIALISRDYSSIQQTVAKAKSLSVYGLRGIIPFDFYLCLGLLDEGTRLKGAEQVRQLDIVSKFMKSMRKRAEATPSVYQHKVELLEALCQRISGHTGEAIMSYNRAIEGAHKCRCFHEEGLASELAAEFYLVLEQPEIASMFFRRAVLAYHSWGANGVVARLCKDHPEIFAQALFTGPTHSTEISENIAEKNSFESLDMASIEEVIQALTGELHLPRLIKSLMKILLQNAGAHRAALLTKHSGEVFVEALGSIENGVQIFNDVKLKDRKDLCKGIIRYVTRSLDPIILWDAVEDPTFGSDPYVLKTKAKSILCSPIMHQGITVAFIYLENNRIHGLFSGERGTVVKMICSSAAIALENAKLTKRLREEIKAGREKEEALRQAVTKLSLVKEGLEADNVYLREEIKGSHNFEEIVGESMPLRNALHKVELVAPTDANVLILGETGTGKELIARAIHNRSMRKDRPLVKVNCAALPSTLIESELFGHEKGAFTGALDRKVGRFELANGGTIFLDEIGDMPLELQAKLLRVLQEGEFERLGSSKPLKVDVRVIAATNRDLQAEATAGTFRKDLFYRLSVFPIQLPPLRERLVDIPLLVKHFIVKFEKRLGKKIEKVPNELMNFFTRYSWPGNIREMQNIIERAMILTNDNTLFVDKMFVGDSPHTEATPKGETLEDAERMHVLKILEQCFWKIQGPGNAADLLGMHHSTLRFRMKKLGIKRPSK